MKKILFLMAILPMMLFVACSSDEDSVTNTEVWYIAKNTNSGSSTITGTFCFFKDGDYDPLTFEYKYYSSPSNIWEDASIKKRNGEVVRSFFTDTVLKDGKGYGIYKCDPGVYYVVAVVRSNKSNGTIWKAKRIVVEKNKTQVIDAIFKDMYVDGYTEWDD